MAEETLRYRVEIDQSDLAAQLSDIKNQIDTAVGSIAFNNAAPLQNSSVFEGISNFNQQVSGGSLFSDSQQLSGSIINGVADFNQSASIGYNKFSESASNLRSFLSSGLESSQLGFQKFTSDLRMAGLISPPQYAIQAASPSLAVAGQIPQNIHEYGSIRSSLGSVMGLGYDPDMNISRGEYKSLMSKKSASTFGDDVVTGTALGLGLASLPFLATPAGAFTAATGAVLGLGDALVDMGAYESSAVKTFGKFIQTASFRNDRPLSERASREAAAYVRNLSEDVTVRSTIGDATDVENLVTEGISSGLFLDTSNVSEFKRRAKDLVDNFREIQHTMRVSSEEAIKIIGDISRAGLATDVNQVAAITNQASTLGAPSGYSTKEMLSMAQQSAEMVRGTGYSMHEAAMQGMQIVSLVRGSKDNYDQEFFRQMGGSQNVALNLQRMGHEFDASLGGRFYNLAQVGGWSPSQGNNLSTLMNSAINAFGTGSPEDILQAQIDLRGQSKQTTGFQKNMMEILAAQENLKLNLGIDNASRDQIEQSLINMGRTEAEAKMLSGMATTSVGSYYKSVVDPIVAGRISEFNETPGYLTQIKSTAGSAIRRGYKNTLGSLFDDLAEKKSDMGTWWQNLIAPLTGNRLPGELNDYFRRVNNVGAYINKQETGGFTAQETQLSQTFATKRGEKTDMEWLESLGSAGKNDLALMNDISENIVRMSGGKITSEEAKNLSYTDVSTMIKSAKAGESIMYNGIDVSNPSLRKLLKSSDAAGWDETLLDNRIYASMAKGDIEDARRELSAKLLNPMASRGVSADDPNKSEKRKIAKSNMKVVRDELDLSDIESEIMSNLTARDAGVGADKIAELYIRDPKAFVDLNTKLNKRLEELNKGGENLVGAESRLKQGIEATLSVIAGINKEATGVDFTEGSINNAGLLVAGASELARAEAFVTDSTNSKFFEDNNLKLDTDTKKLFAYRYIQDKDLTSETARGLKAQFNTIDSLEEVHKLSPSLINRGMELDKSLESSLGDKDQLSVLKLLLQSSLRLEKYNFEGRMEDKANAALTSTLVN